MDGAREARCPGTGLWVPECSCHGCLERMLRELRPELLDGEIRISRAPDPAPPGYGAPESQPRRRGQT